MDQVDISAWKASFFKESFSVDQCLTEYTQKSDLDTLRKDLKSYGVELQQHMSEILKNETEAIVNLAEHLTNLNSKIDKLSIPIDQLREEIRTLFDLIKTAAHSYDVMLTDIKNNNSKQNHVNLKLGLISSSLYINSVINTIEDNLGENLLTLERIVNKYSFQKIYLDELNLMTPDIENVVIDIEFKLVNNINKCFLKAFEERDISIMLRCLRMYVNLQKQDEAHYTFQKYIINPRLQPFLTEKYLEKCEHEFKNIYSDVKKILDIEVEFLNKIVKDNPELELFNFVLNSFWKEFDMQSREGLPHITAPGNPDLFQKRFTSTYNFLKYIAIKAGDENLVKENESFQSHLKRFNLPVYFEIKFQQIAGNFESGTFTLTLNNLLADSNEPNFKLKPSVVLWHTLSSCVSPDVYIDQLAEHFIKLTMMLLSRYIQVMQKILKDFISSETPREEIDGFIVNMLIDLNIVKSLVAPKCESTSDVEKTIFAITSCNMWPVVLKVFKANQAAIEKIQSSLENEIISSKISDCSSHLQNVTAIPRLYRRTNRSPPKEASMYMVEAIKPILKFEKKFKSNLEQQLNDVINNIIVKIANQYLTLVQEVLMSVCKTEESLRRLKSRNLNVSGDDSTQSSDTMSDETKIREQIKYDVGYFCDKLYPLAMQPTRDAIDLLKREVYK